MRSIANKQFEQPQHMALDLTIPTRLAKQSTFGDGQTDTARKPATYFWHGPAKIVAPQLPSTAWLSYNRHLVKAAPEKEFFSLSGWLEGISHAKKQFETEQIKGVIDLSKEQDDLPPPAEDQDYTGDKMVIFGCESISKNAVNFSNLMTMIQTFPSSLHNSNLGGNPRWS